MIRKFCFLLGFFVLLSIVTEQAIVAQELVTSKDQSPPALREYVQKPEPDFEWSLKEKTELNGLNVYTLEFTSQKWQGILWQHPLMVYEPADLRHPNHILLYVTGGSSTSQPKDHALGQGLAQTSGARVAILHRVPNQPLFEGRREDDLISYTWVKFLETGDLTYPLLFPMAKSAVKAIDVLEQFSEVEFKSELKGVVITGASKRGWTSWLAPVADPRIIGTAPMVIDMLNFGQQMKHQKETWGKHSEQIADYTEKGLVRDDGIPKSEREVLLWKMMDPISYREELKLPKLLIVGSNDPYWSLDAMSLYWNDLLGPKYCYRVPNAGHGLNDGKFSYGYLVQMISVFFEKCIRNEAMPQITWNETVLDNGIELTISVPPGARLVRLWTATSSTNDFRESVWESQTLKGEKGVFKGTKVRTANEKVAVFGEVQFGDAHVPYSLSTLVYWK